MRDDSLLRSARREMRKGEVHNFAAKSIGGAAGESDPFDEFS